MTSTSAAGGSEPKGKLLKVLGVTFGLAATLGGMIGLGILRTPGEVAGQLGAVWLILAVWLLGAVYALFGTFQAIELGTSVPVAGGWYAYSRRALGEYAGFLVGWMDWIGYPSSLALQSVTAAEYLKILFPPVNAKLAAIAILIGLLSLNWRGVRNGSLIQEVTSFGKSIMFVLLIGACFWIGGGDGDSASAPARNPSLLAGVVLALQGVIFTYDGWYAAIYFSEENKDPGQSLPKAMIGGVLAVAAIYLLINAALFYVMPIGRIAASELPVADAANVIFGPWGKTIITLLAVVSLISILNSNIMSGPRIIFAMARDGLFFRKAAEVNAGGTPWLGLAVTVGLAVPLILIGTFETLLAISAFLFILLYLSGFVSLIVLRRREPDLPRPYKAWGYPWTTFIVIIGSVAFLVGAVLGDDLNALYAVALILLSYPAYLYAKRISREPGMNA